MYFPTAQNRLYTAVKEFKCLSACYKTQYFNAAHWTLLACKAHISTLHRGNLHKLYTAQCTLHIAQYRLHNAHSTQHNTHCTLLTAHYIFYSTNNKRDSLHTTHCTMYTADITLHTEHSTLHTAVKNPNKTKPTNYSTHPPNKIEKVGNCNL